MTHPTDALRLVSISRGDLHTALMDAIHGDLMRQNPGAFVEEDGNSTLAIPTSKAFLTVDVSSLAEAALVAAPASPPVEQPFVRTPNEDDRLRRALYRLLERHGAGPDVLSVVGSLWDTLDQGECTDLIEDWLITGKTIQVEGDIDEMLASIPEEAPHRRCQKGAGHLTYSSTATGCWLISTPTPRPISA